MRRNRKIKTKRSIKLIYVIWIVLFFITLITIVLLNNFNNKVNPKIEKIVNMDIDKMIENLITEYSLNENYNTIKDILIITKNSNDEIISIDYNLKELYSFSSHITNELMSDLSNLESGKTSSEYYDEYLSSNKDYFVLSVPYGVASNNVFFSNLGPKIPVKIKFIGSILTGVKTKVTDYGINNSLIEVYTTIDISTLAITPVAKKRVIRNYEILVASKIIEGKVPEIYGGKYEKKSSITQNEFTQT